MRIACKIEHCLDSFLEHEQDFADLEKRASWRNPYFSPEWLKVWWKRQPEGSRPVFLVARSEGGGLEGFWPLVERPGLLRTKGLWPFVYDEANYFDPWCTEAAAPVLMEGLRHLMNEFTFSWIPLMRNEFWEKFLATEILKYRLPHIGRQPRTTSFILPQPGVSFEEFWAERVGAKSRKSFRYDTRRLEEKGEVCIECLESFEEIRAVMPATCVVEVESLKSMEGVGLYSIRGKRGFFFELLPELGKNARARLSLLRVNDEPVAWDLSILGPGFLGVHHLSFHQEWKKYSPGKQLTYHTMKRAWDEGRVIDFLPGNFEYKEKLATSVEPVREFHWFRKSVRGSLARSLILWNMKARKKIRQASTAKSAEIYRRVMES